MSTIYLCSIANTGGSYLFFSKNFIKFKMIKTFSKQIFITTDIDKTTPYHIKFFYRYSTCQEVEFQLSPKKIQRKENLPAKWPKN